MQRHLVRTDSVTHNMLPYEYHALQNVRSKAPKGLAALMKVTAEKITGMRNTTATMGQLNICQVESNNSLIISIFRSLA